MRENNRKTTEKQQKNNRKTTKKGKTLFLLNIYLNSTTNKY
jgi:hypothetical protein